jgi:hypothetical protein
MAGVGVFTGVYGELSKRMNGFVFFLFSRFFHCGDFLTILKTRLHLLSSAIRIPIQQREKPRQGGTRGVPKVGEIKTMHLYRCMYY